MPIEQAIGIFQKYGLDVIEMPLDQLRKSRNILLKRFHPDTGGTIEIAQEINAAFDLLLKRSQKLASKPGRPTEPRSRPDKWAWAGHSGTETPNSSIFISNFTDINFIKKSMWELSSNTNEEWTIYGFDGNLFTNTIIVYGSSKIFYYMAIAMIDFQTKGSIPLSCGAVFVRRGSSNDLYLIYANGKYYDRNPIKCTLDAVKTNSVNDPNTTTRIKKFLETIDENSASQQKIVSLH